MHADRAHIRSVFLNNLDFLWDDLGSHQLAGIHQVHLRLDVHDLQRSEAAEAAAEVAVPSSSVAIMVLGSASV